MDQRVRGKKRMAAGERSAQIVNVARAIMIGDGYGALTLRAVASGCDVRIATVQHFFGNKAKLFEAVIDSITHDYNEAFGRLESETLGNAETKLRRMLDFLIEDNKNAHTAGFFYELWNLAHRDPIASKALDRLCDEQLVRFRDLILRIRPELSFDAGLQRAAVIMAATDGLLLTVGYGRSPPEALRGSGQDRLVDILMHVATAKA
ncbi:TetR/AcrR family transcriptional regulator [Mesorhizobium sp. B4-1-1]|uniref:TetR/AcrR family transcriptional regulator n=1 Tax=Mesorhizobium sp. B4-1-1 TaxID=2589890 RepID=UPI00112B661B|nr:TetR/AcrR family transcriptional regulator [Mesorhizobium sp. B4-1-1]TPI21048.1 TetR/AcrR family transcriptional regulator [Mesorhizobium sp. B4-1-1]